MFETFADLGQRTVEEVLAPLPGLASLPDLCRGGERISLLRMFHYASTASEAYTHTCAASGPGKQPQACIGSSPHTDWGLLTLILASEIDSVHFSVNGTWMRPEPAQAVHVSSDDHLLLLVNVGDYLSLLSKGSLASPLHRVVLSDADRLSLVFFYYPRFDTHLPDLQGSRRYLSLMEDQSANKLAALDLSQTFGELILGKWRQVYREASDERAEAAIVEDVGPSALTALVGILTGVFWMLRECHRWQSRQH